MFCFEGVESRHIFPAISFYPLVGITHMASMVACIDKQVVQEYYINFMPRQHSAYKIGMVHQGVATTWFHGLPGEKCSKIIKSKNQLTISFRIKGP